MPSKFRVGDLIIREHHVFKGIPLSMAAMRVTAVDLTKAPFIYEIEYILDAAYPIMKSTTGNDYRLITEAEKILYLKDCKW